MASHPPFRKRIQSGLKGLQLTKQAIYTLLQPRGGLMASSHKRCCLQNNLQK